MITIYRDWNEESLESPHRQYSFADHLVVSIETGAAAYDHEKGFGRCGFRRAPVDIHDIIQPLIEGHVVAEVLEFFVRGEEPIVIASQH